MVVTNGSGDTLVSTELPAWGRYAIDYQRSYYDQPATEVFQANGVVFRLVALSSPSEAVLDYHDLSGPRSTTNSGVHVLATASPNCPWPPPSKAVARSSSTVAGIRSTPQAGQAATSDTLASVQWR